ncbi:MAG: winged helix-turn-helix domain-containing protein [Proteobacteria bacterium]|nr:winged helix-turn-helix domain-containing protein [Pseudomonadota bacterium]
MGKEDFRILDVAPVGVLLLNEKGKVEYLNPEIRKLMVLGSEEFGSEEAALRSFLVDLWQKRHESNWLMRINPSKTQTGRVLKLTCTRVVAEKMWLYLVIPEKFEAAPVWHQDSLIYGNIRLDPKTYTAFWGRKQLSLSPMEFRVFLNFCEHPGVLWSQEKLLKKVWNQSATETRKVDVFIGRLNSRIKLAGGPDKLIQNRRGLGYVLLYLN